MCVVVLIVNCPLWAALFPGQGYLTVEKRKKLADSRQAGRRAGGQEGRQAGGQAGAAGKVGRWIAFFSVLS